ncbi:hypothetical protein HDU93_006165 [Gonapodya sp. JEL0774]|nr:hypothetical protein HDU93_006165 [Gonapodya sp. JEL0774]
MPHPSTLSTNGISQEAAKSRKAPAAPVPAATLLVCAPLSPGEDGIDQKGGFKVLMIKRSSHGFFGSLTVFPGGKIDQADESTSFASLARHLRMGTPGAEFHTFVAAVAAIRETFEETGVMVFDKNTQKADPRMVEIWRKKATKSAKEFEKMCQELGLRPKVANLAPWSRWITPPVAPKRFDARFFLTTLAKPIGSNTVSADGHESVSLAWLRPQEALQMAQRKEIFLITPQIKTLEQLSQFTFSDVNEFAYGTRLRTTEELAPVIPGGAPEPAAQKKASIEDEASKL